MTANDARIEAIRAKAEGLGLEYTESKYHFSICGDKWDYVGVKRKLDCITTAETLLAALSPGPVVRIKTQDTSGFACGPCGLRAQGFYCVINKADKNDNPGPNCPGPAPPGYEWRLCLLPKGVDTEDGGGDG